MPFLLRTWLAGCLLWLSHAPAALAYTAVAVADGEETYGYCFDRPSAADAGACALAACRGFALDADSCRLTFEHYERGFYAWAKGQGGGGAGYSFHSPREAEAMALRACGLRTSDCDVLGDWTESLGDRAELTGPAPPLELLRPQSSIVLIYTHGSVGEEEPDPCRLDRVDVPFGLPSALAQLDGSKLWGKTLRVDRFCTPSKVSGGDAQGRPGRLKVELRKEDLRERVLAYHALGVPPKQIFLAGHSAGAWAALLLEAEEPALANAVIAIAPAFAGRIDDQNPLWLRVRQAQLDRLLTAPTLDGMVFAFEGDSYETPGSLGLLGSRWDISFVVVRKKEWQQQGCLTDPHQSALTPCFAAGWSTAIGDWIGSRLR